MIVFGPIPSRRLGRSLGVNNIPPKHCNYSCIYCQLGLTNRMVSKRREFYSPDVIFREAENKIKKLKTAGEKIDYITFVPDGEPTLDINLGIEIKKLKRFGNKVAVVTNSSLIYDKHVRNDLEAADLVSLKIDSVYSNIWRKINRPHGSLELQYIFEGMLEFASGFKGELITETMLVKGINDSLESIYKTAEFIRKLNPAKAYILVPTRPPAEGNVKAPNEYNLNSAFRVFNNFSINTEKLVHYEGTDFTFSSEAEKELLSILAVHPMRKDAVVQFVKKACVDNGFLSSLIESKNIKEVKHNNNIYYVKSIRR